MWKQQKRKITNVNKIQEKNTWCYDYDITLLFCFVSFTNIFDVFHFFVIPQNLASSFYKYKNQNHQENVANVSGCFSCFSTCDSRILSKNHCDMIFQFLSYISEFSLFLSLQSNRVTDCKCRDKQKNLCITVNNVPRKMICSALIMMDDN